MLRTPIAAALLTAALVLPSQPATSETAVDPIAVAFAVCFDNVASGPERLAALEAAGWELTAPSDRADFAQSLAPGRAMLRSLAQMAPRPEVFQSNLEREFHAIERQITAAEMDRDRDYWLRLPAGTDTAVAHLVLSPPPAATARASLRMTICDLDPGRSGIEALVADFRADPPIQPELDIGTLHDWPIRDGAAVTVLRPSPRVWAPPTATAPADFVRITVYLPPAE